MAINNLDLAIKNAIESISYSSTGTPAYCGWLLAARFKDGLQMSKAQGQKIVLIQFIEETERVGRLERDRKISFYLFAKRGDTNDVFAIRDIHEKLVEYIYQFKENLEESYRCEFTDEMQRLIDQLSVTPDAGVTFSLIIKDSYPC